MCLIKYSWICNNPASVSKYVSTLSFVIGKISTLLILSSSFLIFIVSLRVIPESSCNFFLLLYSKSRSPKLNQFDLLLLTILNVSFLIPHPLSLSIIPDIQYNTESTSGLTLTSYISISSEVLTTNFKIYSDLKL